MTVAPLTFSSKHDTFRLPVGRKSPYFQEEIMSQESLFICHKVIVDGLDGAGKSTLVKTLHDLGYVVADRGNATHMVDRDDLQVEPDVFYLILLAPVDVCRARLAAAGKPMDEEWHTVDSLTHYTRRYHEIRHRLPHSAYIDSSGTQEATLRIVLKTLAENGIISKGETHANQ